MPPSYRYCPRSYPSSTPLVEAITALDVDSVKCLLGMVATEGFTHAVCNDNTCSSAPASAKLSNAYICVEQHTGGGCIGHHKHTLHVLFEALAKLPPFDDEGDLLPSVPASQRHAYCNTDAGLRMMQLLVDCGADVNAVSYSRVSPNQPAADPSALVLPYPVLYYSMEESIHSIVPLVLMRDYEADPRAVEKALLANLAGRPPLLGIPQLTRPRFWLGRHHKDAEPSKEYSLRDMYDPYHPVGTTAERHAAYWEEATSMDPHTSNGYGKTNAARDHILLLEYLVKVKGFDVNAAADDGSANTVLHLHCMASHSGIHQVLLASAFFRLRCSHPQVIGKLLELGADPNARNVKEENAFMVFPDSSVFATSLLRASINGRLTIDAFLKHGWDINARDKAGNTALMRACCAESIDKEFNAPFIRCLLKRGADPFAINNKGQLALHQRIGVMPLAGCRPYRSSLRRVIKRMYPNGRSIQSTPTFTTLSDYADSDGKTCLHHAVAAPSAFSIMAILQLGVDPRIPDKKGHLPMHEMVHAMKKIVEDPDAHGHCFNQDRCIAILGRALRLIRTLAEPNVAGTSARCSGNGSPKISSAVRSFLNLCDHRGDTLLGIACRMPEGSVNELNRCSRLVHFLIVNGASVCLAPNEPADSPSNSYEKIPAGMRLPFHDYLFSVFAADEIADHRCALRALKAFLEAGADTRVKDSAGRTPLVIFADSLKHVASLTRVGAFVEALLSFGTSTYTSSSSVTPRDTMCRGDCCLCLPQFPMTGGKNLMDFGALHAFVRTFSRLFAETQTRQQKWMVAEVFWEVLGSFTQHRGPSIVDTVDPETMATPLVVACMNVTSRPTPIVGQGDAHNVPDTLIVDLLLQKGADPRISAPVPGHDSRRYYPLFLLAAEPHFYHRPCHFFLLTRLVVACYHQDSMPIPPIQLLNQTIGDGVYPPFLVELLFESRGPPPNSVLPPFTADLVDDKGRTFLMILVKSILSPAGRGLSIPLFPLLELIVTAANHPLHAYCGIPDSDGDLPLHSLLERDAAARKYLKGDDGGMREGINPYGVDGRRRSLLHCCFGGEVPLSVLDDEVSICERVDVALWLISEHPLLLFHRDVDGRTPLHSFARWTSLCEWGVAERLLTTIRKALAAYAAYVDKYPNAHGSSSEGYDARYHQIGPSSMHANDTPIAPIAFEDYINLRDAKGRTALHYAALSASTHEPILTVTAGSDFLTTYGHDYDWYAASLVALLLRYGARASMADDAGRLPLHFFFGGSESPDVGSNLLQKGRDLANVSPATMRTEHECYLQAVIRPLLADDPTGINKPDDMHGNTPFTLACSEMGHASFIIKALLCEYRADPHVQNKAGQYPFFLLRGGFENTLQSSVLFFIRAGMCPNLTDAATGDTVLHRLCGHIVWVGSRRVAEHPLISVDGQWRRCRTGEAALRQLLAEGADPNRANAAGQYALDHIYSHRGSLSRRAKFLRLFVEHGHTVDALSTIPGERFPMNALFRGCVSNTAGGNDVEAAMLLGAQVDLRADEDPNLGTYQTPLAHVQLEESWGVGETCPLRALHDRDIRRTLLAYGADVNVPVAGLTRELLGMLPSEDYVEATGGHGAVSPSERVRSSLVRHLVMGRPHRNIALSLQELLDNGADYEDLLFSFVPVGDAECLPPEELAAQHASQRLAHRLGFIYVGPQILATLISDCNITLADMDLLKPPGEENELAFILDAVRDTIAERKAFAVQLNATST